MNTMYVCSIILENYSKLQRARSMATILKSCGINQSINQSFICS